MPVLSEIVIAICPKCGNPEHFTSQGLFLKPGMKDLIRCWVCGRGFRLKNNMLFGPHIYEPIDFSGSV